MRRSTNIAASSAIACILLLLKIELTSGAQFGWWNDISDTTIHVPRRLGDYRQLKGSTKQKSSDKDKGKDKGKDKDKSSDNKEKSTALFRMYGGGDIWNSSKSGKGGKKDKKHHKYIDSSKSGVDKAKGGSKHDKAKSGKKTKSKTKDYQDSASPMPVSTQTPTLLPTLQDTSVPSPLSTQFVDDSGQNLLFEENNGKGKGKGKGISLKDKAKSMKDKSSGQKKKSSKKGGNKEFIATKKKKNASSKMGMKSKMKLFTASPTIEGSVESSLTESPTVSTGGSPTSAPNVQVTTEPTTTDFTQSPNVATPSPPTTEPAPTIAPAPTTVPVTTLSPNIDDTAVPTTFINNGQPTTAVPTDSTGTTTATPTVRNPVSRAPVPVFTIPPNFSIPPFGGFGSNFPSASPSSIPTLFPTAVPTNAGVVLPTVVPVLDGPTVTPVINEPTVVPIGEIPTSLPTIGSGVGSGPTSLPTTPSLEGPTTQPTIQIVDAPTTLPTSPTVDSPTARPTRSAPVTTFAPVSRPTVQPGGCSVVPFEVTYTISSPIDPSDTDLFEAEGVTITFLEEVVRANFDFADDILLESVTTIAQDSSVDPIRVQYETTICFSEDSLGQPPQASLEALVSSVFEQPTVQTLLLLLQNLPLANPISTSTGVNYNGSVSGLADIQASARSKISYKSDSQNAAVSSLGIAAIASTCIVGILLAGITLLRRTSYGDAKYAQKSDSLTHCLQPSISSSRSHSSRQSHSSRRSRPSYQESSSTLSREEEDMEIEFLAATDSERAQSDDPLFRRPFCQDDVLGAQYAADILGNRRSY